MPPCNYQNYHPEWKTKIRPDILKRAKNRCEFCLVENHTGVFRGFIDRQEVYQIGDGSVFAYPSGERLLSDRDGAYAYIEPSSGNPDQQAVKVVLTIAHLDHDTANNCYSNLAALCQKCHNRHDSKYRAKNRKETARTKLGIPDLFTQEK